MSRGEINTAAVAVTGFGPVGLHIHLAPEVRVSPFRMPVEEVLLLIRHG